LTDTLIELAQPLNEFDDNHIAPHPGWKPAKPGKCFICINIIAGTTRVAVDARRIGPIGFNHDDGEAFFCNKPFCDRRALEIKFVRPMRRLTKQDDARVADKL
jgi:hypothetical protein